MFPSDIINIFHDITANDFDLLNPTNDDTSDTEWDPTPEFPRRQPQEWERAAQIALNGNQARMGQPRDYLGSRDIDQQHDWNSDLEEFDLVPDLETFIESHRQSDTRAETFDDNPAVTADILNDGQRKVYDHILDGFNGAHNELNTIVMGTAGVGKSFLIRGLEHGLWTMAQHKFGEERYPSIRSVVRLAAFTGKAAYQVGGVTIHSLLSIGDVNNPRALSARRLKTLQDDLANIHFLFLDEMSMIGLKVLNLIDRRLHEARP
jgi:hypothetical protein